MNRTLLRRGDEMLATAENAFLALSSGLIAILVVAAVFFRYFLNDPLTWTEEFIVTTFTWMLFIGFSSGFAYRMHLRIDALLLVLPAGGRSAVGVLAVTVTLVTLLGLAWFGAEQTYSMLDNQTPMLRISAAWAASAVPASALFAIVHVLGHAINDGAGQALWTTGPANPSEGGH
ncbi:TRAP transporter small permease subunit [Ramlibacter sp. RBP-2]|uniref:TRAP transporter small permease protein n=1 Tax=Ramlibacter lithotrophicus TaxID=2606681 RepID=A0A7X6DFW8_9BURK|nr:TRAP transporter small permease subunit [Ramlibacter lithotrophicus]NKE66388.1 TRAP transporter small permease subunit [Ramlibacter lithotrophicus]